jgi:putative RNase toxin 24 of polymorphic toxin system
VFKGDEKGVTGYETYNHPEAGVGKRVDVVGPSHGGIDTPHVVDTKRHVNPHTGQGGFRDVKGTTRPATVGEVPKRYP